MGAMVMGVISGWNAIGVGLGVEPGVGTPLLAARFFEEPLTDPVAIFLTILAVMLSC